MSAMQDPPRLFQETLSAPVEGSAITLKTAGLYVAKQGQHFPAHYHEELEIIVHRSGHIQCAVEGPWVVVFSRQLIEGLMAGSVKG